jgi:methylated-DNA-[protein]-cysteine S-methyltransferase
MNINAERFDAVTATPLGPVGIRMNGDSVAGLRFLPTSTLSRTASDAAAQRALAEVQAYFDDPSSVPMIPLKLSGTPFQQRVWQALRGIPPGRVLTYGELARRLGTAPRAVGGACRANPCPIWVPCHRVVSAMGRGGYAGATTGYWMSIKERLLAHEGVRWPVASNRATAPTAVP